LKAIKPGVYGDGAEIRTIRGNAVISADGVTLQNVRIAGDLWIAESVGDGDVTLKGVTVEGKTFIRGGGASSIRLIDTGLGTVIVNKKTGEVRIVAAGSTSVRQVLVESGAILAEEEVTGEGFGDVTVTADPETGTPVVTLNGDFTSVVIEAPDVTVQIQGGTVAELTVAANAAGATLDVADDAKVEHLVLESEASVTGGGQVVNAIVHSPGAAFEREPDNLEVSEDVTVVVGGKERGPGGQTVEQPEQPAPAAPGTPSAGGGGGPSAPSRPAIVSVEAVEDVSVKYGTSLTDAIGKLAPTTTITDAHGRTHTVRLTWTIHNYNSMEPGEYEAFGTFTLPSSVAPNSSVPLQVTAKVTVRVQPVVEEIAAVEGVSVKYGTVLEDAVKGLATTTTVKDSEGGTHSVSITGWTIEGYDRLTPGTYTAKGAIELPQELAFKEGGPREATATVTVRQKPVVEEIAAVEGVSVKYGTVLEDAVKGLATTTTVKDSEGGTHSVSITGWTIEGYDRLTPGSYTAKGAIELPQELAFKEGGPREATATVTVRQKPVVAGVLSSIDDVEVEYGTPVGDAVAKLPAAVTIVDSEGDTHDNVEVSWTIEGYNPEEPGEYWATGELDLKGLLDPDPAGLAVPRAKVTVKAGVLPQSVTSNPYAGGLLLKFETPLAAPENEEEALSGWSVTVDGNPNDVVAVELDEQDATILHVGLKNRIENGIVSVSYSPSGLETEDGTPVGAFNETVPTVGKLLEAGMAEGKTLTELIEYLTDSGFALSVVVDMLIKNDYTAHEIALASRALNFDPVSVGVSLRIAGCGNQEVYEVLNTVFNADITNVASVFAVKFDINNVRASASELMTILVNLGIDDPRVIAKALASQNYTLSDVAKSLWNQFSGDSAKRAFIGDALTGAGFGLYESIQAVLALPPGNNKSAVMAAWPSMFTTGDGTTLLSANELAANWGEAGLSPAQTEALLKVFYYDVWDYYKDLMKAFRAANYSAFDGARAMLRFKSSIILRDAAMALYQAGYPVTEAARALHEVWGAGVEDLAKQVLTNSYGVLDPADHIEILKNIGFGSYEVTKGYLSSYSTALTINVLQTIANKLHERAGYPAEEIVRNLRSLVNMPSNAGDTITVVANVVNKDPYALIDLLLYEFKADPITIGVELYANSFVPISLRDLAEVLVDQFDITPAQFVQIHNQYLNKKPASWTEGRSELVQVLKEVFGLDEKETALLLLDTARAKNSLSDVKYFIEQIWEHHEINDWSDRARLMVESGHTIDEILYVVRPQSNWQQFLRDAGLSVDEMTQVLYKEYGSYISPLTIALQFLLDSDYGYGACDDLSSLVPVIRAVYKVYNPDAQNLIDALSYVCPNLSGDDIYQVFEDAQVSLSPLELVQGMSGASMAQLIRALMNPEFGLTTKPDIANVLKAAGLFDGGYFRAKIKELFDGFKAVVGLDVREAADILQQIFNITDLNEMMNILWEVGGYSIPEIVMAFSTVDPLDVKAYLEMIGAGGVLEHLLQIYGSDDGPSDYLLFLRLKALGLTPGEAVRVMQRFDLKPLEMAAWLWMNGYSAYELSYVKSAMPSAGTAAWPSEYAQLLGNLIKCPAEISHLPVCQNQDDRFTPWDAMQALPAVYGLETLDCSQQGNSPACMGLYELLRNEIFDPSSGDGNDVLDAAIVYAMYVQYHASFRLIGGMLKEVADFQSALKVVDILRLANLHPTLVEYAEAFKPYGAEETFWGLLYAGVENHWDIWTTMKAVGYNALQIGTVMNNVYWPNVTYWSLLYNLKELGFSSDEAHSAAWTIIDFEAGVKYQKKDFPWDLILPNNSGY